MKPSVDIKNIAIVALIVAWALTLGIFGLVETSFQRDKDYLHTALDRGSRALVTQKEFSDDLERQIDELRVAASASEAREADLVRRLADATQSEKETAAEISSLSFRIQALSTELATHKGLNVDLKRQLAAANAEIARLTTTVQSLEARLEELRESSPDSDQ